MRAEWSTPSFTSLPDAGGGVRWVGTTIMDEEQYRTEGWQRALVEVVDFSGIEPRLMTVPYWRASMRGMVEYARSRRQRRDDRKARWQARQEEEQAYTDWVNQLPGVK